MGQFRIQFDVETSGDSGSGGGAELFSAPIAAEIHTVVIIPGASFDYDAEFALIEADTGRVLVDITGVPGAVTYYPRVLAHDAQGTPLVGVYVAPPCYGALSLVVDGGGEGQTATVYVYCNGEGAPAVEAARARVLTPRTKVQGLDIIGNMQSPTRLG